MKKIYNILIVSMSCIILAACDNYSYTEKVNSVKVNSAETIIDAAGGTKSIAVETNGNISAYSKDKWLSVSCKGDSVKLNAGENITKYSRHTTVIIKSGGDSTIVNVSQSGAIFSLGQSGNIFVHNAGAVNSYKLKSNVPIAVSSNEDWISGNNANDSLYVTTSPNTTGKPRYGYLRYAYGNVTDSIKVVQYDAADLTGRWIWQYNDGSENKAMYVTTTTDAAGDSLRIALFNGLFTLHAAINQGTLVLNAGDYMGVYDSNYTYLCLLDMNQGELTWNTSVSYAADILYSNDKTLTMFSFADNGSWSGYSINGLDISLFSSQTLSNSTLAQEGLVYMINPVMYRGN